MTVILPTENVTIREIDQTDGSYQTNQTDRPMLSSMYALQATQKVV